MLKVRYGTSLIWGKAECQNVYVQQAFKMITVHRKKLGITMPE